MSVSAPTNPSSLLQPQEQVLSTLNEDGSRRWLSPRLSKGAWLERRRWTAYGLIAIFTLIPYLRVGGRPLLLLDVVRKEFTFFGHVFLPTDTLLLALIILGVLLGIVLTTALFGRIWCGWACPQTVYMEFLYRPLERAFLGTAGRGGRASNVHPARRAALYATYLVVSCYLAHTFLAYFVGVEALGQWVRQSPFEHPAPFLVMLTVTGLMMFDFCYFREQTCILACPYGRLQSVLLDRQSLIISYDEGRGEPRGKLRMQNAKCQMPKEEPHADTGASLGIARGDCVDCSMCVTTCPTGIDIRKGLQLECIGCAQCIDACDTVMDRIGRPRGLIRYSSQAAMAGQPLGLLRWRVLLYPTILLVVAAGFFVALARREPMDVRILRSAGAPFTVLPDGRVANPMKLKVTNRRQEPQAYHVSAAGTAGLEIRLDPGDPQVAPGHALTRGMLVIAPAELFVRGAADVQIEIRDATGFVTTVDCRLLGPAAR